MNYNVYLDKIEIYKMLIDDLKQKNASKERLDHAEQELIRCKREYRAWLKEKNRKKYLWPGKDGEGYGEIVNFGGSYDSLWTKIFFVGEQWSEEDKKEFIDANWQECKPSMYDCTGQIFTWAIDVFNVPNGVVAYIREGIDV